MDIKIVGSVTDESQIEEIEGIAKIFAYEQRMKYLNIPIHYNNPIKKTTPTNTKTNTLVSASKQNHVINLQVHGLA